jgi:hypothetical protein
MGYGTYKKLTAEDFTTVEPWERHPKETPKAFSAFISYRNLPPHKRSLTNAIRAQLGTVTSSNLRQWKQWSTQFGWVWRVSAYDDENDRISRAEHIQALKEMRTRHVKVAQALFQKGVARLKDLQPEDIDTDLMLRLLEKGYHMERESMGSDEIVESITELSRSFTKEQSDPDYSTLSTQELRQILTVRKRISIPGTEPRLENGQSSNS